MQLVNRLFTALLVCSTVFMAGEAMPCDGTLNPPCSRAIYLAKFAPNVVVLPASGPINVPVGLLPFVSWDNINTNLCAQPSSASLSLTLICTPVGGGTATQIGPISITVPTPTTPGPQTGIGSPVTVTIPAGTVTSPSVCLVQGTYTVTFASGGSAGGGTISGTGDVEICIVEPTPTDPVEPRLDLRLLQLDPEGLPYRVCRRGDQAINYFLAVNNDPVESVSFAIVSKTRQTALLPDGVSVEDAPGELVRSISSPIPGTDAFAQSFDPGLIELPDPMDVSDRAIGQDFNLGPNEATIFPVAIRSFGPCLDGSCNEQTVKIEGQFSGGSPAVACCSSLLLVDSVPAKTPLCEFEDFISVGVSTDGLFSPAHFFDGTGTSHHVATHTIGNEFDFFDVPGRVNWVRGNSFNDPLHPPNSNDYVRSGQEDFDSVNYLVEFFAQELNFTPVINNVTVQSLHNILESVQIPMIHEDGGSGPLDVLLNLDDGQISIDRDSSSLFSGPFDGFVSNPPPGFFVEFGDESTDGGSRMFTKTTGPQIAIQSDHLFLNPLFSQTPGSESTASLARLNVQDSGPDTLTITDQAGVAVSYNAAVRGSGVSLQSSSGTGQLIVEYDPSGLAPVPATPLAFIDITSPDAINNPLIIPVAMRVDTTVVSSVLGDDPLLPQTMRLLNNYPNPFNPTTTIRYEIDSSVNVELRIFNQIGQEIRTLVNTSQPAGYYGVEWNGLDNTGVQVASGIYLYQLRAGGFVQTYKMLLLK